MADWHIYTCEWDTANIKIYLDNTLVNNIYKYYKTITHHYWWDIFHVFTYHVDVGSGCNASGTYKIAYGYPYNSTSPECNFRITTGMTDGQGAPTTTSTTLGQAEIDYVKIWQRHPEQDGHTDICAYNGVVPSLSNPIQLDTFTFKFNVTNPLSSGYSWSYSSNCSLVSSSNNSITVHYIGPNSGYASVNYIYSDLPGCPPKYVSKSTPFILWKFKEATPYLMVAAQINRTNTIQFDFAALDATPERGIHNEDATYDWTLKYCLGSDTATRNLTTYTTKGKYASTLFLTLPSNGKYYIEWQLNVKTAYDSVIKKGVRTSSSKMYQQADDTSLWYFDALITDTAAYEGSVYKAVANNMVGDDADSIDILSMINQIRIEQLEPYVIMDAGEMQTMSSVAPSLVTDDKKGSKIYPNPANNTLIIEPGQNFVANENVQVNIYGTTGELQQQLSFNYHTGESQTIDISGLSPAIYFVELKQGSISERHKLIKK